jgi:hypothetical protein
MPCPYGAALTLLLNQATTHRWEIIGITSKPNSDYAISRSGKAGYTVHFTNVQHISAAGDCDAIGLNLEMAVGPSVISSLKCRIK